jgi:4-hydroxy-3-methylbut-2-enyl diphosphate reductase IspH
MKKELKIYLASPRGFCAGVKEQLKLLKKAINKYGKLLFM